MCTTPDSGWRRCVAGGTASDTRRKQHLLVLLHFEANDTISGDLPPCGPGPQASLPLYPGEACLRLLQHLLTGPRALRPLSVKRAADAWNGLSSAPAFRFQLKALDFSSATKEAVTRANATYSPSKIPTLWTGTKQDFHLVLKPL